MRPVDAYTPAQIRACGAMLEALNIADNPQAIRSLIEYARFLGNPKVQSYVRKYRLFLYRSTSRPFTPDDFLTAVGWYTLRSWRNLGKDLAKYNLDDDKIKEFIKVERKKWLNESSAGRVSTGG